MSRQQTLKRSVAALAVAGLVIGAQLAVAGPSSASGYRHHGGSYSFSYSYGGYRPYYGSHYGYPYGHRGYRYSNYGSPYGHRGYRYGHHGYSGVGFGVHGHGSSGALVVGALGAGLLLGHLLTRPQSYSPARSYSRSALVPAHAQRASPTFGYGKQVRRDCKTTSGSGLHQGRRATFGGTFCYDAYGQGYIVPGSEYLIGYTN